jgi:hypothetical protein
MSNGFDLSLSGRSHPQPPHNHSKDTFKTNLYQLGLLGDRYQKKKPKKVVEFSSVVGHIESTDFPETIVPV